MSLIRELKTAISQYDATENRMEAIQLKPIAKEDASGWSALNEVQTEIMMCSSKIRNLENRIAAGA